MEKISGVCTLKPKNGEPVICCPMRLYANNYNILNAVSRIAFGGSYPLIAANNIKKHKGEYIAVFGNGKELRLPNRGRSGSYFVDWVLARVNSSGSLVDFAAIEVQSIDTTGNYRAEREEVLN